MMASIDTKVGRMSEAYGVLSNRSILLDISKSAMAATTDTSFRKKFLAEIKNRVDAFIASNEKAPDLLISLAFGDVTYGYYSDGVVRSASGCLNNVSVAPIGSVPAAFKSGNFYFPSGVSMVTAGGGYGKTPLAHAIGMESGSDYCVIRYGEPLAGYINDADIAAQVLIMAIATADVSVIVIDSVKDIFAEMRGQSMKSGLQRSVLPMMSRWGAIAASAGVSLVVPVNPSSKDEEVNELLIEAARSNATTTIYPEGTGWRGFSRSGEGLQRSEFTCSLVYDTDGPHVTFKPGSQMASSRTTFDQNASKVESMKFADEDSIQSALRRSLSSQIKKV